LNNCGVTLLELHAYKQASECFQDATIVMRATLPPYPSLAPEDIHIKLERARERVQEPEVSKFQVRILSLTNGSSMDETRHASNGLASSLATGVCLRFEETSEPINNTLLSAAMVLNSGTAFLCRARICRTRGAALMFQQLSIRQFNLAHGIIKNVCPVMAPTNVESCSLEDHPLLSRRLFFEVCILFGFLQALVQDGRMTHAKACLTRIARLQNAAQELESIQVKAGIAGRQACAAAA
jgi:hypothetical protein